MTAPVFPDAPAQDAKFRAAIKRCIESEKRTRDWIDCPPLASSIPEGEIL